MSIDRGTQLYGYAGRQLRVNLTDEKSYVEVLDSEVMRHFVGGVGYGVKLLYDELPAGVNPLSAENKLVFATGPLTGTGAPGSGSVEVCFKSPLTGIWGEARSGGEWGGVLRKAGYDFLIVEGKASEAKYIVINDDKVEIRDAGELRGQTSSQKDKLIRVELGEGKFETVVIGPAGENLVRFACIMAGECAFGRAGAGAVMGAKNLLAIAVRGSGQIAVAKQEQFSKACKECYQKVLSTMGRDGESIGGTPVLMLAGDKNGDIPTKNWRANSWGKAGQLYNHFTEHNLVKADSCYKGCVLRCKRVTRVESGIWQTKQHKGSEYESLAAFTFFVLNEDMDAAVHADYLCNEYGLDTISTGGVIAFAMDCYAGGIISKEEVDGLDLSWGNADAVIKIIKKISSREGFGRLLGEGVRLASQHIGKGSEDFAIHVKGLEGAAHDSRSAKTQAVLYGMNNRGMCHMHPFEGQVYETAKLDVGLIPYGLPAAKDIDRFAEEGKASIVKILQDYGIVPDILGICKFYIFDGLLPEDLANLLSALTGWEIDAEELLRVGGRIYDLQRRFNTQEGITRKDDMLPERCLRLPEFGIYATVEECQIKNYEQMLTACYEARGWDKETGIPPEE